MKNSEDVFQYVNGSIKYYLGDNLYREDGGDSITRYYRNDVLHRIDGPAKIYPDGRLEWWRYGLLHREDGPAIVDPLIRNVYSILGEVYTEQQFFKYKFEKLIE